MFLSLVGVSCGSRWWKTDWGTTENDISPVWISGLKFSEHDPFVRTGKEEKSQKQIGCLAGARPIYFSFLLLLTGSFPHLNPPEGTSAKEWIRNFISINKMTLVPYPASLNEIQCWTTQNTLCELATVPPKALYTIFRESDAHCRNTKWLASTTLHRQQWWLCVVRKVVDESA